MLEIHRHPRSDGGLHLPQAPVGLLRVADELPRYMVDPVGHSNKILACHAYGGVYKDVLGHTKIKNDVCEPWSDTAGASFDAYGNGAKWGKVM